MKVVHIVSFVGTQYNLILNSLAVRFSLCFFHLSQSNDVPCLFGLDTRALTKKIRTKGVMLGKVAFNNENIPFTDPNTCNLIAAVSRKEPKVYGNGPVLIIAVDCGIKYNIIRCLVK